MGKSLVNTNAKIGTLPVFFTALSTILGAILFLRFGWALGQVGFIGVIGIVVLGHVVTIPTAFAVAEIATNQRVQGGGAYYIISRSFGLNIGGAIGFDDIFPQKTINRWFARGKKQDNEPVNASVITVIKAGRLPISPSNITMISFEEGNRQKVISKYSEDADLTLVGFTSEMLKNTENFTEGYEKLGNILFVNANRAKAIN